MRLALVLFLLELLRLAPSHSLGLLGVVFEGLARFRRQVRAFVDVVIATTGLVFTYEVMSVYISHISKIAEFLRSSIISNTAKCNTLLFLMIDRPGCGS